MTEQPITAAIARAFTQAWASHDMDTAASYLTDDVTFQGPVGHAEGKQAYVDGLAKFAGAATGVTILAAFGDDSQALIMYDLATAPSGTMTCAELLTFRDGKIVTDRFMFNTYPVRGAGAAANQPPSPATPSD